MESNWPSADRKFERFLMECPVDVSVPGGNTLQGWCLDLAEGGLGATISAELPIGQKVIVSFVIATTRTPLELNAVVKYRKAFWYGLEFTSLNTAQRQAIRAYGRSVSKQATP